MNFLYGEVRKNQPMNDIGLKKCQAMGNLFCNKSISIENQRLSNNRFQERAFSYHTNRKVLVALQGEIYNISNFTSDFPFIDHDTQLILELYIKYELKYFHRLDGLFSCVIIDFQNRKLYIAQDRFTSLNHIYYYDEKDRFLFASDIKLLLRKGKTKRNVNKDALPKYLKYSYVPGNETLFQDIYKIPSENILIYDFHRRRSKLKEFSYNIKRKRYSNKKEEYLKILDRSIKARIEDTKSKKLGFVLSGGYDTNLLLDRIVKNKLKDSIIVFSVGSTDEHSEIISVRKIVKKYRRIGVKVRLREYVVDGNEIDNLPGVLFDYGEPISQQGVILQHYLARLLNDNERDIVISGDGADQLFFLDTYCHGMDAEFRSKRMPKELIYLREDCKRIHFFMHFTNNELSRLLRQKYSFTPYQQEHPVWVFTNYCLIKKLKGKFYNITVRLPYLNNALFDFVKMNFTHREKMLKRIHKEIVKSTLPNDIFQYIAKAYGTTPTELLFSNKERNEKIFSYLVNSKIMRRYFNVSYIRKLIMNFNKSPNKKEHITHPYVLVNDSEKLLCLISFLVWHLLFISTENYIKKNKCTVNLLGLLKESG